MMRLKASACFLAAWGTQLLASSACFAQAFDPTAGANPVAPSPYTISGKPDTNLTYSSAGSQTTLPSNVVPERYRSPSGTIANVPAQGLSGTTATPAVTYAMPVTTPDQAARIEYQNQLTIVNAIDAGNVQALQQHFAQIHFWQTSGAYTPGPINLNFLDQAGNTPVIRAAYRGNVEVLKLLAAEGANVQGVNYAGQSAGSIATQYGHTNFARDVMALASPYAPTYVAQAPAYPTYSPSAQSSKGGSVLSNITDIAIYSGAAGLAGVGVAAIALGGNGSDDPLPPPIILDPAGTHPVNLSAGSFVTTEAQTQSGVLAINADDAFARGYEGQIYNRDSAGTLTSTTPSGFVKLAVIDSGVDLTHPDLDGNLVAGSVTCNTVSCAAGGTDSDGHGTNVAGVALAERNNIGMHGVAPQAKFISVRIADAIGSFSIDAELNGLQYALTQNVQVINSSYGTDAINTFSPAAVRSLVTQSTGGGTREAAYQNLVSSGVINVWAAGNDGPTIEPSLTAALPVYFQGATAPAGISQTDYDIVNPSGFDWSRNWVAVISVNSGLSISAFSQKCGLARNWCLAAPGEIASTTTNGGGYNTTQGTSFSAPHVTGALAVLLGAFPHLPPETALQILFETATDLGAPGTDDIYGRGLVNLDRATSPTRGGWSIDTGSFSSASFASSGFNTSAAFGNALARSNAGIEFRDAYGKNYTVPLATLASSMAPQPGWLERANFRDNLSQSLPVMLGETAQLRFAFEPVAKRDPAGAPVQEPVLALHETFALNDDIALNARAEHRTNLAARLVGEPTSTNITEVRENPYLGLTERASSMQQTLSMPGSSLTMLAYHADLADSPETYNFRFDTAKPLNGAYSAARFKLTPDTDLELNQGFVLEENSMLGSESQGAFALGSSNTLHAGVQATHSLTDHLKLFGRYDRGRTQTETVANSLFSDIGTVTTDSYAFGVAIDESLNPGDRLQFSFAQPMRIQNGTANLTLPVATARDGSSIFETTTLNLTPTGREQNLRMSYTTPLVGNSTFNFDAIYRDDANHIAGADEAAFYTTYSLAF